LEDDDEGEPIIITKVEYSKEELHICHIIGFTLAHAYEIKISANDNFTINK
jgi:hypothetical protein